MRSTADRIRQALSFEFIGILIVTPLFAWRRDVSLIAALVMEISFATFYMGYALVFIWCYDILFPPQRTARTT